MVRDLLHSKETYYTQKRPITLKRDLLHSKETFYTQKRPITLKRDLLHSKVSPVYSQFHMVQIQSLKRQ